jgi:hypothetical protein
MPKAGHVNPRRTFYARSQSMRNSFPRKKAKLEDFNSSISKAETLGRQVSDKKMVKELKKMTTVSLRMLRDIQGAMRQAPELKLPGKIMSRFVYVILNAKLLLSRIERLKSVAEDDQMPDGTGIDELDSIFDDGEGNLFPGKKKD